MNTTKGFFAALLLATTAMLAGCADDSASAEDSASVNQQVGQQLSDEQLKGKLAGILRGVTYISEGDYGYKVIEGGAVAPGTRISKAVIKDKLADAILANTDDQRDIRRPGIRSERFSISSAIADGEAAQVPADRESEDYDYANHDRQLMIALKTMRSQLRGVTAYRWGVSESGDQDSYGTAVILYVGISKTSGKLLGILTQAVWT